MGIEPYRNNRSLIRRIKKGKYSRPLNGNGLGNGKSPVDQRWQDRKKNYSLRL